MRHLLRLPVLLVFLGTAAAASDDGPDVVFLDREEAREAIVDESTEPYFSLLQPMEMQAKTGSAVPGQTLEAQRAACRRRYRDAVGAFTEAEQEAIRWYVGKYHEMLRDTYPLFTNTPWRFLKLKPPAEGGLPHTRGPCVVLPPYIVTLLVAGKDRGGGALTNIGSVLLHEQLHVVQRAHRERMERFYRETWKYVRAESIERGAWLDRHQVVNPDGVDARWVYLLEVGDKTRWVLPDLILNLGEGPKRMPRDLHLVVLDLEKREEGFAVKLDARGMPVFEPLSTCESWLDAFPGTPTSYHPNETMADLFVKLVVHDHVLGCEPDAKPMLERYRKEFRELLGNGR